VHSEARKVPDMASTPGRAASSKAPVMAWTPLPKASSTVHVLLAVAEATSGADLDTTLSVQFPFLLATCWKILLLVQSALLEWVMRASSD
jgi:hypothetical protein